jgi:prepilin-type N-terminal cleavage/methylation domain-containing protein
MRDILLCVLGRKERLVTRRTGFTLVETLIVVVVVGMLMLVALPKLNDALATSNLTSARSKVLSLYNVARAASVGSGRITWLHVRNDLAYVTAIGRQKPGAGVQDTITPPENLNTQYGVAIVSNADSVRINPNGVGGMGAVIRLVKGTHADTINISAYGRVLK